MIDQVWRGQIPDCPAYVFWYVLEGFLPRYGAICDNDQWMPCGFPEFLPLVPGIRSYYLKQSAKISLPHCDDIPAVYTIPSSKLNAAKKFVKAQDFNEDAKNQFIDWCTKARFALQDLVLFYY